MEDSTAAAAAFGHHFDQTPILPQAPDVGHSPAAKRRKIEEPEPASAAEPEGLKKDDPQSRMERAVRRGEKRVERGDFERLQGRIETSTGLGTVYEKKLGKGEAAPTRLMMNYRAEDFGNERIGRYAPKYTEISKHLPDEALPFLLSEGERPKSWAENGPPQLTPLQAAAVTSANLIVNVSEAHGEPGADKVTRALTKQRIQEGEEAPYPLDPEVNPMVEKRGAAKIRRVLAGKSSAHPGLLDAVKDYMSESSDSEDEPYALREQKLSLVPGTESKKRAREDEGAVTGAESPAKKARTISESGKKPRKKK